MSGTGFVDTNMSMLMKNLSKVNKSVPTSGGTLMKSILLLFATTLLTSAMSPAQEKTNATQNEQYPKISLGSLMYVQYDWEMTNRNNYNAFDITRSYINFLAELDKNVKFRLTPDIGAHLTSSGGTTNYDGSAIFRLKYAFVELDNFIGDRSWLRIGLHQTPWLDFEESINRYRVQGTMFSERIGIVPGSSDYGIGYLVKFLGDFGEFNTSIVNGEGFKYPESNKYKSLQSRVTIRPFSTPTINGLRISLFGDLGRYDAGKNRNHWIGFVSFENPYFVGTAQYLQAWEQPGTVEYHRDGYSLFGELRPWGKPEGFAFFGRFDHFDPNTAISGDSQNRAIAGGAYWSNWGKVKLGYVLNYEHVSYEVGSKPNEDRLLFQIHVGF